MQPRNRTSHRGGANELVTLFKETFIEAFVESDAETDDGNQQLDGASKASRLDRTLESSSNRSDEINLLYPEEFAVSRKEALHRLIEDFLENEPIYRIRLCAVSDSLQALPSLYASATTFEALGSASEQLEQLLSTSSSTSNAAANVPSLHLLVSTFYALTLAYRDYVEHLPFVICMLSTQAANIENADLETPSLFQAVCRLLSRDGISIPEQITNDPRSIVMYPLHHLVVYLQLCLVRCCPSLLPSHSLSFDAHCI